MKRYIWFIALAALACGGNDMPAEIESADPPSPLTLSIISGQNLIDTVQGSPQQRLIVQASRSSNPVQDIPITFSVVEGGGSLYRDRTPTDSLGQAFTLWFRFGEVAGPQTVWAAIENGTAIVVFDAQASPAVPIRLRLTSDKVPPPTFSVGDTIIIDYRYFDQFGNQTTCTRDTPVSETFVEWGAAQDKDPPWHLGLPLEFVRDGSARSSSNDPIRVGIIDPETNEARNRAWGAFKLISSCNDPECSATIIIESYCITVFDFLGRQNFAQPSEKLYFGTDTIPITFK